MNTEVSSGGIIVYRSPRGWLVLLMKDKNGNWTFPKGKIEAGENALETAVREIWEEVGVKQLEVISLLTPVSYWYHRGKSIKKTVHYYLFQSKTRQKPNVQKEEGITEARWMSWNDAMSRIGYPDTHATVLKEAGRILE